MEATQVIIDSKMWHMHKHGILFIFKEKGDSDTLYSMDEPQSHYAEWNKPVTKAQILYDPTYLRYLE